MQRESTIRGIAAMRGFTVSAVNGEIGKAQDLFFDDQRWVARYIRVDTGDWLSGLQVLIPPMAVRDIDWENGSILLKLTRDQIEASPAIAQGTTVSRQFERKYYDYFKWAPYWTGPKLWGETDFPESSSASESADREEQIASVPTYPDLRNAFDAIGCRVEGSEDSLGTLSDIMIDDRSWELRWITVDTKSWWFGGNVLVNARSIEDVVWDSGLIQVDITRDLMKASPELQMGEFLTLEQERQLLQKHEALRKAA